MEEALRRADRLIEWMSGYIGSMAPGKYANCFYDLNQHFLFMERLDALKLDPPEGKIDTKT
jgi:hypothetical protein